MSLFKANVLDKAITEINAKSDLQISYEQFKSGRTITHIQFKIKQQPITDTIKHKKTKKMTAKQVDMFGDKLNKDPSFQNHYKADAGESTNDYANKIKEKLVDTFYVKEWMPYLLEKVGYRTTKMD